MFHSFTFMIILIIVVNKASKKTLPSQSSITHSPFNIHSLVVDVAEVTAEPMDNMSERPTSTNRSTTCSLSQLFSPRCQQKANTDVKKSAGK